MTSQKVKIKYLTIIPFVDNAACDVEQDDVRLNVDKASCAEKDESSFASYPRSSINANSEFHFEFKQNNAGRYVLSIYKKKILFVLIIVVFTWIVIYKIYINIIIIKDIIETLTDCLELLIMNL